MTDNIEAVAEAREIAILSGGTLPDGDQGVKAVAELAQKAILKEIVSVETKGLGDGLPAKVPMILNHQTGDTKALQHILEAYRQYPARRRGDARVDTLSSFIDLTNRHKTDDSVIFARAAWPQPKLTAVIDYHRLDGTADYGKHRIVYPFPITDEFKAWLDGNSKLMDQGEFARFMEDHAAELTAPYDQEKSDYERLFKCSFAAPNELIDLARHLEIFANHKVKQGIRLNSGESVLEFSEEHVNGKGEPITIPGIFMVAVPAFIGGDPVRIPARLRYRLQGGIKWAYQLYRPAEWLREQVQADMAKAAAKTGLPAFEGAQEDHSPG